MSDPDDLWEQLCAMPRPHKVVDFPRKKPDGEPVGYIAMWVLTQAEQEEAIASADRRARTLIRAGDEKGSMAKEGDVQLGFKDLYTNAVADEILYRACRKVGKLTEAFFPMAAAMRTKLTVDEVGLLMTNYWTVQDELGPLSSRMTVEESNAYIARLRKSGERHFLDSVTPDGARDLLYILVCHPSRLQTDTSSPGPQPVVGTSSTSNPIDVAAAIADAFEEAGGAPE